MCDLAAHLLPRHVCVFAGAVVRHTRPRVFEITALDVLVNSARDAVLHFSGKRRIAPVGAKNARRVLLERAVDDLVRTDRAGALVGSSTDFASRRWNERPALKVLHFANRHLRQRLARAAVLPETVDRIGAARDQTSVHRAAGARNRFRHGDDFAVRPTNILDVLGGLDARSRHLDGGAHAVLRHGDDALFAPGRLALKLAGKLLIGVHGRRKNTRLPFFELRWVFR